MSRRRSIDVFRLESHSESVKARRYVVLGGAGTMGRIVVRDLWTFDRLAEIRVADFDEAGACAVAKALGGRRVQGMFADARDCRQALAGADVVINCVQHDVNLRVMAAALAAGVHYVDLGGLFTWTRRQLRWHRRFVRAGLMAVLGMGCAPGITNVMSRHAVERLGGKARTVKIRVGYRDLRAKPGAFYFPYSAQTIVEELTLPAYIWRNGRWREVTAGRGWERVTFPRPVGPQWTLWTRHSELATVPVELGLRNCDFKVSFDRGFVREVQRRLAEGWTVRELAKLRPPPGAPRDAEVARVEADGRLRVECRARSHSAWGAGAGEVDTACPASVVAQMMARGELRRPGVWAPEAVVSFARLRDELERRGLRFAEVRL